MVCHRHNAAERERPQPWGMARMVHFKMATPLGIPVHDNDFDQAFNELGTAVPYFIPTVAAATVLEPGRHRTPLASHPALGQVGWAEQCYGECRNRPIGAGRWSHPRGLGWQ
ncbi:MAG TPA: hypothetical protein VFA46_18885 [Actinomycetes bacterium]|nr:hypothetical protein [Actinomycetes bacterium]